MQRNDDLIRSMLFEMETSDGFVFMETMDGEEGGDGTPAERIYNRRLMADEGLVLFTNGSQYRMTSRGHDYLDAIRSDTIWQKTKDGARKAGGATLGMMFEIAVAYLKKEAAHRLGLPL